MAPDLCKIRTYIIQLTVYKLIKRLLCKFGDALLCIYSHTMWNCWISRNRVIKTIFINNLEMMAHCAIYTKCSKHTVFTQSYDYLCGVRLSLCIKCTNQLSFGKFSTQKPVKDLLLFERNNAATIAFDKNVYNKVCAENK